MAPAQSSGPEPGAVETLRRHGIPASAGSLPVLRDELDEWARSAGLGDSLAGALALATYEAMANAVEHAYGGAPGPLDVEAAFLDHGVEVTVTDHGAWRSPRDSGQERRRGLPLIRRLADEAVVSAGEKGTRVRMRWEVRRQLSDGDLSAADASG
ncbi:ATP-binding protein [Saccharopolyspora terrae]|uniref:ATP-binding protein n=1 Tax=Saccharopolyspora terrae TaxID=2530384 RepID=A0A4V2YBN4_9PSEU|nr:ATP-binding protein [Saccharopolyspora terrae]TDD08346.1 ATP-binding protein [Saccharopolyspora terrae]